MVTAKSAKIIDFQEWVFDNNKAKEVEHSLEPVAGSEVLGTLPNDLVHDFVEVIHLQWQLDEYLDILKGRIADAGTAVIRAQLDGDADFQDILRMSADIKIFKTNREAYEFFKVTALHDFKQKRLVYNIREKFDNFTHGYDVRVGWVVVRLLKKYVL